MVLWDDSLISYQLEPLTVYPTCGSFTCKEELWYQWDTAWVGVFDVKRLLSSGRDNDFRKDRLCAHRYK